MTARRLLPLAGLAFVVIALVAVLAVGGDSPTSEDSAQEVFDFYDKHTLSQAAAALLFAAAVPFLILFAVHLATSAWWTPAEAGSPWRWMVIVGAALVAAAILSASTVVFAAADGADNAATPEAVQALNLVSGDFWVGMNAAFGVMMLGAAGCLLGRAAAPKWLGWVALVLGVLLFIPFADFFALIATLLWIIVVSVMLFAREKEVPEGSATAV
jgi:hypothetical protein